MIWIDYSMVKPSKPCSIIFEYVVYNEAIKREEYSRLQIYNCEWILLYETVRKYATKIKIANAIENGYNLEEADIKNLADKIICVDL